MKVALKAADPKSVAVIGGGWAGCAAAVELAGKGCRVTLFESARMLGGRARRVEHAGQRLDNGQHILLGAYRETLGLMRRVGIDPTLSLLRLPLQMRYPPGSSGMDFLAARLPAPFHLLAALLRAKGLSRADKLALARFSSTARWMGWQLHDDCPVSELLERFDQTPRLIALLWRPLCIAALNTMPERASAQVFLAVLRDSLGSRRAASDMLLPRCDLSALFPERAAEFLFNHQGAVHCGRTVNALKRKGAQWQIDGGEAYDAVIVATQPAQAARLLEDLMAIPVFEYEAITTVYLQYATTLRLALPLYALQDDAANGHWGQFVFDRGHLDPAQAGLLAVVVSASSAAIALGHEALVAAITQQLVSVLCIPALHATLWHKVISEKRATFACTPSLERPANASGHHGLFIAGDYTAGDYPATLEAAVRSGMAAAKRVLEEAAPDIAPEIQRAHQLIAAVDAGGLPLNPARVNDIARHLGLEVSRHAPMDTTIARIREALQRL
jgi:squalene-associated FAD-dependent desaturase